MVLTKLGSTILSSTVPPDNLLAAETTESERSRDTDQGKINETKKNLKVKGK